MKSKPYAALVEEYQGRIGRFVRLEEIIVREATGSAANDTRRAQEAEATAILAAIPEDAFMILLEVTGEMVSSEQLAERIRRRQDGGTKTLCFVVGGYSGVAEPVKRRADWLWSLSQLTFTHEMARVLVAEQVYRAFTILHNFPYSK